jgi:hypothetical protein
MSYFVRLVIDVQDSFKADAIRWRGGNASLNWEAKFSRPSPICESAPQSRKLLARVATPKFAMIETLLLVLFLVVTVVAVTSCFVELSRLLDGDALGQVAAKAIKGGV